MGSHLIPGPLLQKRPPSNPETWSSFFIPLHLIGPHRCCTATHICRNIHYPSSSIVTVSSCPTTTLLSPAEVLETSQRLTAVCTCQLSSLSFFLTYAKRRDLHGHLDKYNSFLTSGEVGVFLGPAVGNEGCMGFRAGEKSMCKEQLSGK